MFRVAQGESQLELMNNKLFAANNIPRRLFDSPYKSLVIVCSRKHPVSIPELRHCFHAEGHKVFYRFIKM